jgi:hypothetical protein
MLEEKNARFNCTAVAFNSGSREIGIAFGPRVRENSPAPSFLTWPVTKCKSISDRTLAVPSED